MELPSQVVSGPDLGSGFLLQLTRDGPPLPGGYTVHLQEGGTDGGSVPTYSPARLGFEHPRTPCMYGGPACWHRSYALPETAAARVRATYHRLRYTLAPMLAQAEHVKEAPIHDGLTDLLARIALPLERAGVRWQVGGSAAAWLRRIAIAPADIDLGVEPAGVERLSELLEPFLVEPVHSETGPDGRRTGAAAFLGTLREGIRVEWWGLSSSDPVTPSEWGGPGWAERCEWAEFGPHRVPVAPLEFEMARLAARGSLDRLAPVLEHLYRRGPEGPLARTLLSRPSIDPSVRARIEGEWPPERPRPPVET